VNTVCIATYNGEKFIEEQLRSILVQIDSDDEVIISDDGSTDNTLDCIALIQDPRIRILHSQSHSCKHNFINALQHAKGEVIFLSDQDDVWLPDKYAICLQELQNADLICTNSILVNEQLDIINPDFFSIYKSGPGIIKNIINNTYYGSCMAFHRHLLQTALPMPQTDEIGHDVWLGLVAEIVGKVLFIPQPLLLYRRHNNTYTQTTNLLTRSKRSLYKKIANRWIMLYHIIIFYIKNKILV
jgi:glycosyltransferase involved in cell wall biosynthesis